MACSYLRKTKLYKLSCLLFPEIAFPKMISCSYFSGFGREGIEFVSGDDDILFVRIGCLPSCKWFHLVAKNEEGKVIYDLVRVLSDLNSPVITYSSQTVKPALMPEYLEG